MMMDAVNVDFYPYGQDDVNYNYYDNNYVYNTDNYEYNQYDLDVYAPTGFGNETDYVEGDHDDHDHHMGDHDHHHYDDDHYHSDHSAYDHDHYGDKTPYAKNPYGASEANAYGAGYDDGTGFHC